MGVPNPFRAIRRWPVIRQIESGDIAALGESAKSPRSEKLKARIEDADRVVDSVCPFCGVGCAQLAYVKGGRIIDIEGDPRSPVSQGCLCPKGASTFQLFTGSHRLKQVLYRKPHGTEWEPIPLERAMDMVAERVKRTRDETWETKDEKKGLPVNRTLGMAMLGGATLDIEECYLMKKLFTALGGVQIDNQARI